MILDDADHPAVEGGVYHIGYNELVDGYWHAYEAPVGKYGRRTVVRYSRSSNHPPDPRCPECRDRRRGIVRAALDAPTVVHPGLPDLDAALTDEDDV